MARLFQIPNFKRDDYQRPEQKWVCGLACDGKACAFGPTASGACSTTGECRPAKEGDRWKCTRPDTRGGACADGPLPDGRCCRQVGPCQPVLGMRARRGRYTWGAVLFTGGLLLALLGGASRERSLDPGPLTSAHGLSNARCSDCHAARDGEGGALVGMHRPTNAACLRCHNLGDHPSSPHGFDGATLARLRSRPARADAGPIFAVLALARAAAPSGAAATECITCHKEHHGKGASLTAFTDAQCQVCHKAAFTSFSVGHPDFGDYPFRRSTRIIFDHAKHMQVHFAEAAVASLAPKGCNACHVPSAVGGFMLVKGFDQACSACHGGQIEGEGRAGDKGLAFFRVPGLDTQTLAAKGHPVGDWPADADGKITPFMRLLLGSDPAASSALQTLGDGDLMDLGGASADRLAAAETLAWGVKALLSDLVTNGQDALMSRLGESDPGADRGQLRAMTAQLPRDGLVAAQAAWFPNLLAEVANHRAGIPPAPAAPPKPAAPVAAAGKPPAPAAAGDDLLADTPAPKPPVPVPATAPKPAGDDLLGGDDLSAAPKPAEKPQAPQAPAPPKPLDPESWAAAGGWYRSADNFTLYYRPTGHADAFMTIWLSVTGRLSGNARDAAARTLFTTLGDPEGPGLCMKCHSVGGGTTAGSRLVNWHAGLPSPANHAITKFNHSVHFSLLAQQGCQTCHQLRPEGTPAVAAGAPAAGFAGNFTSVAKATCAACHNAREAGEDCQLCHVYHTGEIDILASPNGPMGPAAPKAAPPGPANAF